MPGGGHRLSLPAMEARYGARIARALLREAHIDATDFAKALIVEEAIACDWAETGRFRGFWTASERDRGLRALEALMRAMPLEAEAVAPGDVRDEVATDLNAGGVVFPRHGGLNPAKWVAGLMQAARRAGAVVQGDAPVTALRREGGGFVVETLRGALRAGQVLLATNGHTGRAFPWRRRRIVPVPSFIMATETLGADRVRSLFPKGRMVVETRERGCYHRPSPDGPRIVVGDRAAMAEVPDAFARRSLAGLLRGVFPGLADVALTHSWRGRTGFSFDLVPSLGGDRGLRHAMGYCGNGNAMAPWLGHKAALGMLGDPEGETAFARTGFSTRWWHRGSDMVLPFADIALRLGDLRDALARRVG
jgi:glycine/D-amino acid oxidase-like deaminating enzyme